MPDKKKRDRDTLLALLLAAYLLNKQQIAQMATALATGYLASQQSAYREAASTVGSDKTDWEPSQEDEDTAHEWAQKQAQGIADTYEADLRSAIETFLESYEQEAGSLEGATEHADSVIGQWCADRAAWKSEQISNYSCGSGAESGTQAFIIDLKGGNVIDGETGEAVEIGDIAIACLPEEASNDVCATVAGQLFDASDYADLPAMPNHGWCPHGYIVTMV